jgi:hypothetical protein
MRAMANNCCLVQSMTVHPVEQPRARSASLRPDCARIRIRAQSCAAILDRGADLRQILGGTIEPQLTSTFHEFHATSKTSTPRRNRGPRSGLNRAGSRNVET